MEDRRHDDHPHPPPDVPERRVCSDTICDAARNKWFEDTLLPKLRMEFIKMLVGTVLTLWGVFWYINRNAITEHQLEAVKLFESIPHHESDMSKIEMQIEGMKVDFRATRDDIISRLDRNLSEIKAKK